MTNEELAAAIRRGEREKLADLWAQVERFVWRMANRRPDTGAVDREDLYQSGYLALVAAVDSYDPERGAPFLSWLAQHLLTAFSEAGNYRSEKQRRDPIHTADSLDRPLGEDADGATLEAVVAAPDSEAAYEEAEARIWQEELHAALETALDALPDGQGDLLRERYFNARTLRDLAAERRVSIETIRQRERAALQELRRPRRSRNLRAFLDLEERTPYYLHVGMRTFQQTGESSVDRIVAIRDGLRGFRNGG